ncbi:MAG: type II toxin-antitoxin system VapC family toxin [Chloroflexota bacterium]
MRDPVVIDASVAFALVLDETDAPWVRGWIAGLEQEGTALLAPAHFWLEVVNALQRRHRWSSARVLGALRVIDEMGIAMVTPDRATILTTNDLAERHRLPAYDAGYLATAIACDARLATLDRALAAAAGARLEPAFAADDESGVRERTPAYESPVTGPASPDAAAYLATLRRRALLIET